MGAAVWQFMWLIDKVTKIDEGGYGWVLGGKPINLSHIGPERTVSRNLQKLKNEGYIIIKRTPYGLIIKVTKAKKRFANSGVSKTPQVADPGTKRGVSNIRQDNKTINSMTISVAETATIATLLDAFKLVNPAYERFFGNNTQRAAAQRLIERYPLDLLLKVIGLLPKSNTKTYFPTITSPLQLEEKYASLEAAFIKEKSKQRDRLPTITKIR
jgi:hypothetical protein